MSISDKKTITLPAGGWRQTGKEQEHRQQLVVVVFVEPNFGPQKDDLGTP